MTTKAMSCVDVKQTGTPTIFLKQDEHSFCLAIKSDLAFSAAIQPSKLALIYGEGITISAFVNSFEIFVAVHRR
ncbi:hypothetical protein O7A70_32000 [Mesorhizobium sp. Cs1299R1N1]|uniref:hypothetical protein n=1 Tax=Mesorhizobium sp. Cs1299R1N1 TaxID=3015172 RepID=UPI00301C68CA